MAKLIMTGGTEYDLTTSGFYYTNAEKRSIVLNILTNKTLDEVIADFSEKTKISTLSVKLTDDLEAETYNNFTVLSDIYSVRKNVNGYANKIQLSLSTPEVVVNNEELAVAVAYAVENIPDTLALECKSIFDNWEDIPEGTKIIEGKRLNYNSGLWKCAKEHNKQSDWYPGKDPTLFEQLDAEKHAGTQEDPIPVPDSVTTSGFTYIYGKYYSEGEDIYLCQRGNSPEELYGQEIKLNYFPSALIGNYFTKI